MIKTKIYVTRDYYKKIITNTIDKIVKEKKVSRDTASVVLFYSDLFRQFMFVFLD